jgi:hypothetical protein
MRIFVLAMTAASRGGPSPQARAAAPPVTESRTKRVRWADKEPVRETAAKTCRVGRMKNNPAIDADWNKPAWKDAQPWTLEYRIPVRVLAKYSKVQRPAPGVRRRAHFYKCADETSRPHWLTWSPVTSAAPAFHRPEYFGTPSFE